MGNSLSLTSQILGFISFGLTLMTLIGVYRDVITTIKSAPRMIPITLGNLREEIESERHLLLYRMRTGDHFGVFDEIYDACSSVSHRMGMKVRRERVFAYHLMHKTMKEIWQEFKNIERPFLIKNPGRAEAVREGDYWGDSDIDKGENRTEKLSKREKSIVQDREDVAELGIPTDAIKYYHTGFTHRFIWWQSRSDVENIKDQIFRLQIRRMKHDITEADELIKRCVLHLGGQDELRGRQGGPNRGGGGGGRRKRRKRVSSSSDSEDSDRGAGRTFATGAGAALGAVGASSARRASSVRSRKRGVTTEFNSGTAVDAETNPKANSRRRRSHKHQSKGETGGVLRESDVQVREAVHKRRSSASIVSGLGGGSRPPDRRATDAAARSRRSGSDQEDLKSYVRVRAGDNRSHSRSRSQNRTRDNGVRRSSRVVQSDVERNPTRRYSVVRNSGDEAVKYGKSPRYDYEVVEPGRIFVDTIQTERDERDLRSRRRSDYER